TNLTMMMSLKPANMIMFFQKIYGLLYKYKWYNSTFAIDGFSAPQTALWLIKHWFSASTIVVKIATIPSPHNN
ncbi:MAG: hypothetical protein ORN85_06705, partial [Sediminibacterium sp.]|nr:hypothetical protein [Sediminibacterium sp.]